MTKVILKQAFVKAVNNFKQVFPIILGVVMLVSLVIVATPQSFYKNVFTGSKIIDPLAGAVFGSIAAGNPITSYIIGGELLDQGVSLLAVTAFIFAWVSVGVVQLPAESLMLGKRFAFTRNIISFISAIIIAILTVIILSFL
ncbi:hypothetical protein AMJ49_04840 [Parcubacteria bacterium DG_74_2]|nr:MAG: hypothetical protein AMJ49_04840 [Parcubacteria bacterium DG_74_2]